MQNVTQWLCSALAMYATCYAMDHDYEAHPSRSGVEVWVDVDTPEVARTKISSRGETWELVMSDEFEIDGRTFEAGKDHLWTALDIPDGVNAALEYYSPDNVYTKDGKLIIRVDEGPRNVTYFNQWLENPAYESSTLHYTAGMIQSWNKFCFQGGLIEVATKLPGAINTVPTNEHPNVTLNPNAIGVFRENGQEFNLTARDRIKDIAFYPTWPGVWLMGNLGRALFTASTTRMWPWTYNECDKDLEPHQAISACNPYPGFGLNPNQGRGAPEIDILEGGGAAVSSSIQVAPGMPEEYRRIHIGSNEDTNCVYDKECSTPGANIPDAPTSVYAFRGHKNWYQGLRYASNNRCPPVQEEIQLYEPVAKARQNPELITNNTFEKTQMSAARDVNADIGLIDGNGPYHWGINYNGTCFPISNGYHGTYVCDPDNKSLKCPNARTSGVADTTNQRDRFEYQVDAISADWDIGHEAYTTFYTYQVEWVMGDSGYVRWNLMDQPLFEIPSETLTNPPQGGPGKSSNPKKIMIEEPLYIIFNVALATSWWVTPPNYDVGACRGNETHHDPFGTYAYNRTMSICDSFPMYMEIDYIRVYQDKTKMHIGCDPASHPTKKWIDGHIEWYTDAKNPMTHVDGGATCNKAEDCQARLIAVPTGRCVDRRCDCIYGFGGPRCTKFMSKATKSRFDYFGPQPMYPSIMSCLVVAVALFPCILRHYRIATAKKLASTIRVWKRKRCDIDVPVHLNRHFYVVSKQTPHS